MTSAYQTQKRGSSTLFYSMSTTMFSTLPPLAHHFQQTTSYAPQVSSPLSSSPLRPSPLSLRDGNTPHPVFQMSSPSSGKSRKDDPYSKRITRVNPLIHNRSDGRETRRKLFLKKVRDESEEKRWNARGGDDEVRVITCS